MKPSYKKEVLNKTLHLVATLLVDVPEWFIGYGTLLGITRNNSCIDKDDDVDIICNKKTMGKIKKIFIHNGFIRSSYNENLLQFKLNGFSRSDYNDHFLQFKHKDYGVVDFYCCNVKDGTYFDIWQNVIWQNCFPLQPKKWKGVMIYLPKNNITKLLNRYGKTWKISKKSKGTQKNRIRQFL